jgi:hypothetical protein
MPISPTTKHASATTHPISNNNNQVFEATYEHASIDANDCEDKCSTDENCVNDQHPKISYDEPNVFSYDADNCLIDGLDDDDDFNHNEHDQANLDKDLNELKEELR